MNFYTSVFQSSASTEILRYGPHDHEPEGTVKLTRFSMNGERFMAMDSSLDHQFTFSEAVSLLINCESQEEVDYYWEKLTEGGDPRARQCGWLKDRFGVSWQVVPTALREMLQDGDSERVARVTRAFLQMKKLDIESLQRSFLQS